MSIEVSCGNGHRLKVQNSFAGKTGLCPVCRAPVRVPRPQAVSEDDVLGFIGQPTGPSTKSPVDLSDLPPTAPPAGATAGKQVQCPQCLQVVSVSYSYCPRCGMPLAKEKKPPLGGGSAS